MVSLQTLDPIFVDFRCPSSSARVKTGLTVRVTVDAIPGAEVTGKITTINPEVDPATRNIRFQATLDNPDENLLAGDVCFRRGSVARNRSRS